MTRRHLLPLMLLATPLTFTVCAMLTTDSIPTAIVVGLVLMGFWCMGAAFQAEVCELKDEDDQ